MFSLEVTLTPRNKNGKWGKSVLKTMVNGFQNKSKAANYVETAIKHLCMLNKRNTNTFLVEVFILCDGIYTECDRGVLVFNKDTNSLHIEPAIKNTSFLHIEQPCVA